MEPAHYILEKLEELKNMKTQPVSSGSNVEEEIFRLLMSKKFRKYSVNPEYKEHIHSAVKLNISKNEPIKLTLVFGGYKLWRLTEETPEVDWAELFSLMYYAKWLKPICDIYKPGVWLDFYSDDVVVEYMNTIPETETKQYIRSFRDLLQFMISYLPENFLITLNRVGDQYASLAEFRDDLDTSIDKVKESLGGRYPQLTPAQAAVIDLNVKLSPDQARDNKWREKTFLIHEGYTRISKRRPYFRTDDKIMLITRPANNSLAVGTTKRSVVKFWIGAGVLLRSEDGNVENIYSPSQLEKAGADWEPVNIPGLEGKNFRKIRVVG
jgi:hypothetical protein